MFFFVAVATLLCIVAQILLIFLYSFSFTVVFVVRDPNDNDATATSTINVLKDGKIFEKLKVDGMTVTDLRGMGYSCCKNNIKKNVFV